MTSFVPRISTLFRSYTVAALLVATVQAASAQSFCSSDGQPRPTALLERFINADCDGCWKDPATPALQAGQMALDWVLPGSKGDEAPLSAVASRDGVNRLVILGDALPDKAASSTHIINKPRLKSSSLRVAHGLALSGYIGVSMEFKSNRATTARQSQQPRQPHTAWLVLVESIPQGTEGTPVARNLVRNALQVNWNGRDQLSKKERSRFFESRVMSLTQGVNPDHLRVMGWVEDANGKVLAAAQSGCTPLAK
jgi:hypothetical protein